MYMAQAIAAPNIIYFILKYLNQTKINIHVKLTYKLNKTYKKLLIKNYYTNPR